MLSVGGLLNTDSCSSSQKTWFSRRYSKPVLAYVPTAPDLDLVRSTSVRQSPSGPPLYPSIEYSSMMANSLI